MVKLARIVGLLITVGSICFAAFYVLWFFGCLPINPDLAIRIPVLLVVLALCFIAAWVGYVMATAPTRPESQA